MVDQHTVIIRQASAADGFEIFIEPKPAWSNFDVVRPDHRSALRYASSLRTVHGWKVRDETGEAA